MENEILRILPQTVRAVLLHTPESRIEELRLRVGQKPSVLYAGCEQILNAEMRFSLFNPCEMQS